ncbi:MAG: glucuronosyltransferase [bacterium]|nr:glucuronosyltransferase [bacterium]
MIFVTVGGQKPFDRLVSCVDAWAADHPEEQVFAQIGESDSCPTHIEWTRFLAPEDFRRHAGEADAIIAHAGMGIILTAIDVGTPILIMPRRASLGEHRNEHQIATVRRLRGMIDIPVANDESELRKRLGSLASLPRPGTTSSTRNELVTAVRDYIERS